jgi:hypothetical protein
LPVKNSLLKGWTKGEKKSHNFCWPTITQTQERSCAGLARLSEVVFLERNHAARDISLAIWPRFPRVSRELLHGGLLPISFLSSLLVLPIRVGKNHRPIGIIQSCCFFFFF